MTTPKSEEDGILREWAPLSKLLGQIPLTFRRGLFFEDVKFTCIDAISEFIVLGTNVGVIFWYDRNSHLVQRFLPEKSNYAITCVKVVSTVDYMVAAGDSSGVVSIFKIPKPLPDWLVVRPDKSVAERFTVGGLHVASVTCLEWSLNGQKLFSGDASGKVVYTEIDFFLNLTKAKLILTEEHGIVQLSYNQQLSIIVISTFHHCIVCNRLQNDWKPVKIGVKERNCLSELGGVISIDEERGEPLIYCCRPGLRLWQADLNGAVQKTLIFKDSLRACENDVLLLREQTDQCGNPPTEFGKILNWSQGLLVSYTKQLLLILDPKVVSVKAILPLFRLTYACATGSEIFVISADRELMRLSFTPDMHNSSIGGVGNTATADTVSPLPSFNLLPITGMLPEVYNSKIINPPQNIPCEVMYGQDPVSISPVVTVQDGAPELLLEPSQQHVFSSIGKQQFDEIIYRKKTNKNKKWRRSYEVQKSKNTLDRKMWSSMNSTECLISSRNSIEDPLVELALEVPAEIFTDLTNLDKIIQDVRNSQSKEIESPSSHTQENQDPNKSQTAFDENFRSSGHTVVQIEKPPSAVSSDVRDPSSIDSVGVINLKKDSQSTCVVETVTTPVQTDDVDLHNLPLEIREEIINNNIVFPLDLGQLSISISQNELSLSAIESINCEVTNSENQNQDYSSAGDDRVNLLDENKPVSGELQTNGAPDELKDLEKFSSLNEFNTNTSDSPLYQDHISSDVVPGVYPVCPETKYTQDIDTSDNGSYLSPSSSELKPSEFDLVTEDISNELFESMESPRLFNVDDEQLPQSTPVVCRPHNSESEDLSDYCVIKREISEESQKIIHPWLNSLRDIGCGWKELECPDKGFYISSDEETIILCTSNLKVFKLNAAEWELLDFNAEQLVLSPTSRLKCKISVGVAHYSKDILSNKWNLLGRNIEHASVNDKDIWYICQGELFRFLSKSEVSTNLPIPGKLEKIYIMNKLILAITEGGKVFHFNGSNWKPVSCNDLNIEASHLALGPDKLVWLIDSFSNIYVTDDISVASWWKVTVGNKKQVRISSLCATEDSILLCDADKPFLYMNKTLVKGYRWEVSKIDLNCCSLSAECLMDFRGTLWILAHGNKLYSASPASSMYKSVPFTGRGIVCMAGTPQSLWLLTEDGHIHVRQGMSETTPSGTSWTKLNLEQINNKKIQLVHISCGFDVVWGCDIRGKILMCVGSPQMFTLNDTFAPAWVVVDGAPLRNNTFTKVYVGPQSFMVWALDSAGNIYVREAIFPEFLIGIGWVSVPGIKASQLCISGETVWALTKDGVYKRMGIKQTNFIGDEWILIPGELDHISVSASEQLWGVDSKSNLLVSYCDKAFPISSVSYTENGWTFI